MCFGPDDSASAGKAYESAKRKRPSVFNNRRPTMLPPPRVRSVHEVEDDGPHVTFQDDSQKEVYLIPTALSFLDDDCCGDNQEEHKRHQLWYNKADIQEFRREASSLSKRLRDESESCLDEYTRGLEVRASQERQQRKQMVVRRILDAQDDDCDASELAQIAEEHSVWSRKVALAQAHKDYYAAYHPNLTSVLPEMPALLDCHKDLARTKRSLGNSFEQTGRRVRCRMW